MTVAVKSIVIVVALATLQKTVHIINNIFFILIAQKLFMPKLLCYFTLRLENANRPISPDVNNQIAAGTGTAEGV